MKMIKVKTIFNTNTYINIDFIESVSNNGSKENTTIETRVGAFEVKGTPEEIVAMIHEAEGNK